MRRDRRASRIPRSAPGGRGRAAVFAGLASAAAIWALAGCAAGPPAAAPPVDAPVAPKPRTGEPEPSGAPVGLPGELDFLGEATIAPGFTFEETVVGGLSGIAYDSQRDRYYAVSDDPSSRSPARFYTLEIDLTAGSLAADGARVEAVTLLSDSSREPFEHLVMDAEAIALTPRRTLLISSEGNIRKGVPPSLREFGLDGRELRRLPVPGKYLPRPGRSFGVRHNQAFEALARTAAGDGFYLGTENALHQDGPATDVGQTSPARILRYGYPAGEVLAEHVYRVEAVVEPPASSEAFRTNGLVELLDLGGGQLLALERSFTLGAGNSVRLFAVSTRGATDVRRRKRLAGGRRAIYTPVAKRLVLDLATLGIELDNLEGLAFGPRLADGRQSLVLISDDNFSPSQKTQVLAFAVSAAPGAGTQTTDP